MEESSSLDDKLKKAITLAVDAGYQLNQEAFSFLQKIAVSEDPERLIEKFIEKTKNLPEKPLFITRDLLEETLKEVTKEKKKYAPVEVEKGLFRPYAKQVKSDIEIVEDPTDKISSIGDVKDFLRYFRDRFTRLERILRKHLDVKDAGSVKEALEAPINAEVKFIGIVSEKREKKKLIFMRIEDLDSVATVMVPPTAERTLFEKTQKVLLDQVVCVCAIKGRSDFFIATDFIWPDLPEKRPKKAYEPVCAALISDLHIGSKNFLAEAFNQFVSWLNGKVGNSKQLELAGRVKYVVISGDLVDGIGVYPNQEAELAITDIYEQYRVAADHLKNIPDYIEIIIIPGNHDATRQALPQPAIPRKYADALYERDNITMLGDPSRIRLHKVDLLLYHGRSLDDIIGVTPDITYQNLITTIPKAMELLLKMRHLAPIYGRRTPIAPESTDYLVIETPPDILHVGHVHVMGYENYRGTLAVNSGAWQTQTSYQRKMGLTPTPAIVPVVDLRTFHLTPINFT